MSLGKGFCVFLRNIWPSFSGIHRPMIHWSLEDDGNMVLCNIRKHLPSNTLSHSRRPKSSITPLSQLQCTVPVYVTSHLLLKTRGDYGYCCVCFRGTPASIITPGDGDWLQYLWNVITYPVRCMGSHSISPILFTLTISNLTFLLLFLTALQ